MSTRTKNSKSRVVFNPKEYDEGVYENSHSLSNMNLSIRREDTRHGGTSEVTIARPNKKSTMRLTLAEARSLKAFLDRELQIRAR